jgi:hypothetical protein
MSHPLPAQFKTLSIFASIRLAVEQGSGASRDHHGSIRPYP